jgi:hypothetical protein
MISWRASANANAASNIMLSLAWFACGTAVALTRVSHWTLATGTFPGTEGTLALWDDRFARG